MFVAAVRAVRDLFSRRDLGPRPTPDEGVPIASGLTGHFRTLLDHTGDLSLVLSEAWVVRYANPSITRVLGHRILDLRGQPFATLLHDGDVERIADRLARLGAHQEPIPCGEARLRHAQGGFRWFDIVATDLRGHSGIHGVFIDARDVTERREAQEALRLSEERYALAARGANDGLWDWDLTTGRAFFSDRWRSMVGVGAGEQGTEIETWLQRVAEEDRTRVTAELESHVRGEGGHFESEHRLRRPEGGVMWVLVRGLAVRDAHGRASRMAGSLADITGRKATEAQLQHAALRDALTGLSNRAVLQDRLARCLQGSRRRSSHQIALLYVDLDRFKVINDSLGHLAGDAMLTEVAQRLQECVRPSDTVSRLGGDEFCLLLEDVDAPEEATRAAERVLEALRAPFHLSGQEVFGGASVGIAMGPGAYAAPDDLIRDADIALYRAKAHGRGVYQVFDADMHARVVAQLQLEGDLRRATDRGDFVVHMQPVMDVREGRVAGFEALARWRHPTRGLVRPREFMACLEEMNLLGALDHLVLEQSIRHAARWATMVPGGAPWVSVNISPRQLVRPGFVDALRDLLAVHALPRGGLKLEITENDLMGHGDPTLAVMRELADLGVEFFLDDFGTGYSSLSYLHRLPIHALKIDQGFTSELGGGRGLPPVIQAIFHLALSLDLILIAEGVENERQATDLLQLGCRLQQGHHFGEPLPADAADDLLLPAPRPLPGRSPRGQLATGVVS